MKDKPICVWNLGTPCGGEIKNRLFFDELKVSVCDQHVLEHQSIENLYDHPDNKMDIEDIMNLSHDERLVALTALGPIDD